MTPDIRWSVFAGILGALAAPALFAQPLNEHCVVSVLNRVAQVKPDGSWHIGNIPSTSLPVRATSACVEGGVTRLGQSDLFNVGPSLQVGVDAIFHPVTKPVPVSLHITAPVTKLTAPNQTVLLNVTANFVDNTTADVTKGSAGTSYFLSNSSLATITPDGLVTAKLTGNLLVQAINEGTEALIQMSIVLSGDSDGDGIPDDVEIANGLDPNNPADAFDDPDHDGLTNLEEFQAGTDMHNPDTDGDGLPDGREVKILHTNPLLKDSDGDGVPDNIEVATGSDPNDPKSFNLAAALSGIRVSPPSFSIAAGASGGFQQLTVTGDFKLGGTVDLTSTARGTTYTSSDLQICRFTGQDGQVFGVAVGNCVVTVSNNGFSQTVSGSVTGNPSRGLSALSIAPGYGNAIDTLGSFAYMAAGASGLLVVDVSDPLHPIKRGSLVTPGNANDVRVIGNLAYLAAGPAGLVIVDVSNPAAPVLVGTADTPGEATHIFVFADHAYIGDGPNGVAVINIANPAAPVLVKQVAVPDNVGCKARGMDIVRTADGKTYLLVALELVAINRAGQPGLEILDVTQPASAFVAARLQVFGNGTSIIDPVNLRVNGNSVYLVGVDGIHVVDVNNILAPVEKTGLPPFTQAGDIEVTGGFAEVGHALLDVSNPLVPVVATVSLPFATGCFVMGTILSGPLMFNSCGNVNVTNGFDKGTADDGSRVNSASALNISQIFADQGAPGVVPQVTLLAPAGNSTVIQGSTLFLHATAQDAIALRGVTFQVNGVDILTDNSFPYAAHFAVPVNATTLTITARATDLGNNVATTPPVTIAAIPDPLTTAVGRVVDTTGTPLAGAPVACLGLTGTTGADGRFSIAGLPDIQGAVLCNASLTVNSQTLHGAGASDAVAGATTNLGDITIRP